MPRQPQPALFDGALVESVLMRYRNRITLCISSQCGCGMNCPFCATGQNGLTRNMSTAEIVDQIVRANRVIAAGAVASSAVSLAMVLRARRGTDETESAEEPAEQPNGESAGNEA